MRLLAVIPSLGSGPDLVGEVPDEDAFLFLASFMSWAGGGETGFAFLNLLRISPRLAASSD